jgi:RNA polymerase sigma factor (sigma-70 family)
MDEIGPSPDQDLSQIGTIWSMVYSAHQGSGEAVSRAQQQLMERYSGAVYRYLMGALHDRHAADDLFQEFALRFVRGAFRNANPERGRFRDFVKTALYHLIIDHHNRKKKGPRSLPVEEVAEEPAVSDQQDFDAEFLHSWRQEILCRTWEALARASQEGQPFYTILRLRAEKLDLKSAAMAEELTTTLGKPVSADWVRQNLRRARERFADLLLDELAGSLEKPTRERLEQELIDLNLLGYCQQALHDWNPGR